MFKRHGQPLILSGVGSSIIFIGQSTIEGIIILIDELLRPSGLITEIREHSEDTVELVLHT
ncbi:MAG: hypothetical protein HZC03_02495 [Candidatus Lloydbacteria bacterium]|nr:hypothetical protein [Candidatus Lloydbacteria bacterium]